MDNILAVLLGLVTGGSMVIAISGVWVVLHLPARISEHLRALGTRGQAAAMILGLSLAGLSVCGVHGRLPAWAGAAALMGGGAFVGMLSCALGEILEVVPAVSHRLHLGSVSKPVRWAILVGKGVGAVMAGLLLTL
ncbi:MAG: stage V sporulation protein AB [Clostridia bacterium]|nr:stage V sporulation protein AB [Clostridia bacterium]